MCVESEDRYHPHHSQPVNPLAHSFSMNHQDRQQWKCHRNRSNQSAHEKFNAHHSTSLNHLLPLTYDHHNGRCQKQNVCHNVQSVCQPPAMKSVLNWFFIVHGLVTSPKCKSLKNHTKCENCKSRELHRQPLTPPLKSIALI